MNANGVNTSIASAIDVRGWANKRGNMGGYQLATRHERTQFAFLKINWKNTTYLRWRLYLIFALTWIDSGAVLQDINWSFSATRQTARTKLIRYIWSLTLSVQPKCIEVKKNRKRSLGDWARINKFCHNTARNIKNRNRLRQRVPKSEFSRSKWSENLRRTTNI